MLYKTKNNKEKIIGNNEYSCNFHMKAFEPKWVNPVLNTIRVNSLRLGGLHFIFECFN